jgi:hypothetical protein
MRSTNNSQVREWVTALAEPSIVRCQLDGRRYISIVSYYDLSRNSKQQERAHVELRRREISMTNFEEILRLFDETVVNCVEG